MNRSNRQQRKNGNEIWYVHCDDLPLLEDIRNGNWVPRTTLLSPFDNLICDRLRTKMLFHFKYSVEIYVPPDERKFGYYVLPILHSDRLIGRADPIFKRDKKQLVIKNIYAERDAPKSEGEEVGAEIAKSIEDLGKLLGAESIYYHKIPHAWKQSLKSRTLA